MNATDRFESELAAWLTDTAVPMGLDDIDPIVERTVGVRQRPRWTFPGRWLPMRATTLGRQLQTPPWRVIAALAALLILLATIVLIQAGSQSSVPDALGVARNGLVTYGVDGDIVTVDPESGATTTLVGGAGFDAVPVFSHDGTRIAFVRTAADEQFLYTINADGSDLRQLTTDPLDIISHSWSPDDSELVFTNGRLFVVAADGSGLRQLDLGETGSQLARWRPPDGQQIMFTDSGDDVSLFLVGRDGTGLTPIRSPDGTTVTDGTIAWTPDGQRLVTLRETAGTASTAEVHVLTISGDGTVTDDSVIGPAVLAGPWAVGLSPDGGRVAVPAAGPGAGDDWQVAVVPLDGSESVVMTGPSFVGEGFQVGWSPDGATIYVKDEAQRLTWLLDQDGGDARQATWFDPSDEPVVWQHLAP